MLLYTSFTYPLSFSKIKISLISIAVSEVVNCEYGNFTQQLALTAQDSRWRSVTLKTEDGVMTPRVHDEKTTTTTTNFVRPPSEIFRFYVLLYRNIIKLHRDWVYTYISFYKIQNYLFYLQLIKFYFFSDCDSFENITTFSCWYFTRS